MDFPVNMRRKPATFTFTREISSAIDPTGDFEDNRFPESDPLKPTLGELRNATSSQILDFHQFITPII
jgi:hypothetical protein